MSLFADESSICAATLQRLRQRAPIGERTTQNVPILPTARHSIIPGISIDGLMTIGIYEGTINHRRFEQFLKYKLVSFSKWRARDMIS